MSRALPDYYETLQVSHRADRETIERVFRYLANRYHPDKGEGGDTAKFTELVEAHMVLSDPEQRAAYDVNYERIRETRWKLFDQSPMNDIASDTRVRLAILSILYVARRNSVTDPGVGVMELERFLSLPDVVVQFQTWYLRENGWIERLTTGLWAITASGVDKLFELGGPARTGPYLLREGDAIPRSAAAGE